MRFWLVNSCLLVILLLVLPGCSPVTTLTVMQHRETPLSAFPGDAAKCREYADSGRSGADAGWNWRIGIYELQNAAAVQEADYWRCLTGRGWQPVLQVIGPTRTTEQDFRHALSTCLAGTLLVRMVPERLSGEALLAIVNRMHAHSGIFGTGTTVLSCLSKRQWRIVREAGFLVPGRDAVAHSVILPPAIAEVANKFVDDGNRLVRDTGQGIHWRKGPQPQRPAGPGAVTMEQLAGKNWGSFAEALAQVAALNRSRSEGRNDWRLPWIDEAQSLIQYLVWSGQDLQLLQSAKLAGLVWTGEQTVDGTPLAIDIATGAVVPLGCEGMYCALILPVAGHGWHGKEPVASCP